MKKDAHRFIRFHGWFLLVITILGVLSYINTIGNGFISDDIVIIAENRNIASPSFFLSVPAAFIRPFLYFVIHAIWGVNPVPFHLLNIFFHALTAATMYVLAYAVSKNKYASFVASCIFAVHPAISEGVSWISGGNYPQYGFFLNLALVFYIYSKKNRRILWISAVLFTLSLLSSQKAITAPLIIVAYEFCFGSLRKNWKAVLPFAGIAAVFSIFYFLKIGTRIESLQTDFYLEEGAYENVLTKIPFAVTSYIQLLLFPARLTLYHSELMGMNEYIVRIFGLLVFIIISVTAYIKNKGIFFWLVFFIINLLSVLTPFKVASTMAERYMYYASFGIILSIVLFMQSVSARFKIKTAAAIFAGIVICMLMIRTWVRNADWADELTFWKQTAITSPNAFSVRNNLGAAYARINEDEKAVSEFNTAIALNPRYADAYKNMGYVYLKHNDADTALEYYSKALALNPRNWQFYNDTGAAYIAKQDLKKAEEYFLKALALSPENELLYLNLGRIYMMRKENEKAQSAFEAVLRINPNNSLAVQLMQQLTQ